MKRIQAKKHKIGTYEIEKISLSCVDDKRFVLDDGVHNLAYFHKDCSKEEYDKNKNKDKNENNENENENQNENVNNKQYRYRGYQDSLLLILLFFYEKKSKHLKHKQKHLSNFDLDNTPKIKNKFHPYMLHLKKDA